ncbi:MAG TPA: undecaprenyl-diphosphate phosphatase [Candidatus Woesebacteria bacterium]|nr:undecaprenyl-diphosphate phosphatase [Candidatus Woesebacteria bacterium]HRS22945.1 undecaprenyl-diphosphate phosphatase [Candidatus Woesebacteria bacterium]HRT39777.1 undecaprenyl-diphosphate phosphatase [Candidatus Woesebacteria bacterium]
MSYLVLAIVQGITEFLPISSTGHLNLYQHFFHLTPSLSLDIFLHGGTLIAVLFVFRKQFRYFWKNFWYIIMASIPAGIIGILFKEQFDTLFANVKLLPFFFLITTMFLFLTKNLKTNQSRLTYKNALIIGIFQAIALLPGVSRSGATIAAGLLVGLPPLEAFNFSFALFIPATLGAIVLAYKDIVFFPSLIIPTILTIITGILALNFLKKTLISKNFWKFSLYTFILALILLLVLNF